jgi:hypothetical protein
MKATRSAQRAASPAITRNQKDDIPAIPKIKAAKANVVGRS